MNIAISLKPEYIKRLCEFHQESGSTSVEYYSMCISLALGSLNDVVGYIKNMCRPARIDLNSKGRFSREQNAAQEHRGDASNGLRNRSMNN